MTHLRKMMLEELERRNYAQTTIDCYITDDAILDKLKRSARIAIAPFCGFLVTTLLSTIWMIHPNPSVYWINTVLFLMLVTATGIYGVWASYR